MKAFIAFAEHQNFTRAARALHLSQPALFAQIGKLEEELGVRVYRRRGRNVELTEAGRRALAFARDMRERIDLFEAELRGETLDAPVVLCAGRGSYLHLLGPAIRQFRKRARWSLSTLVKGRDDTMEAVAGGRAHVGVTAALSRVPEEVTATPIIEVKPQLALLKAHRLAQRRRIKLTDLAGEVLIAPPAGRAQREQLEAAMRAQEVRAQVGIEADGWDLMLHFVSLGLGVAVVNDGCRLPRGVVTRPLSGLAGVSYVMLTRPSTAHPGAQQLADAIVALRKDAS